MRSLLFIVQKEFLQVFRNKQMLPIIFVMPIIQLLLLVNAATYEISRIELYLVDQDHSRLSRLLASKFTASKFFNIVGTASNVRRGEESLKRNSADLLLVIPPNFTKELGQVGHAEVQLIFDAVDGFAAGLINSYALNVLERFNHELHSEHRVVGDGARGINVNFSYWYNPDLNYEIYMAPGILVVLITMIGIFLSAMNIVKEKEMATIEQLNVTPIRRYQFIAGKLLPFWILALAELAFGLAIAKIVFAVPTLGSIVLVFSIAAVYLVSILGIGLLVSTVTETQQQAMFISWFIMVIFILMSGLFTPIESMPEWAQLIAQTNPVAHFVAVIRRILLKGASLSDVALRCGILAAYGGGVLALAVLRYRKVES